jgi:ATP-dependent DNA ligase
LSRFEVLPAVSTRPRKSASKLSLQAMEARSVDAIPRGKEWQYEPKWDGFRCLLSREGEQVTMLSKAGEDLTRYFPEVVAAAGELKAASFVLDGELVVPQGKAFSFDALLQRIHPAASRVKKLAAETPALFIAFDLLSTVKEQQLSEQPLTVRRPALEAFAKTNLSKAHPTFRLSSVTKSFSIAQKWLARAGGGCDGVIAKRTDLPYQAGNREGMQKIKHFRSADCVIGGFRYATNKSNDGKKVVGSLLLGLYDDQGLLHHVGFTSAIKKEEKPALTAKLTPLISKQSFTGNTPGGPSRWSTERSTQWCPLQPKLVVEISYDHFSGERFRHGTSILRWRPDKSPKQCTFDQLEQRRSIR